MKIVLPQDLSGNELHKYLRDNKQDIRKNKRIGEKRGLNIGYSHDAAIKIAQSKAIKMTEENGNSLIVEAVANLAGWMDHDDDVILRGAYNKTIADKKNNRPSLKNHIMSTDAIIGDTLDVFTKELNTLELGIQTDVSSAQGLVFQTRIRKEYDASTFYKYLYGAIKEHSIGLFYKNLELAINNPDYKEEYAVWQKFYGEILNKRRADEMGYFWAVREIDVYENSAVVFGSNEMTPTLSIEEEKQFAGIATDNDNKGAATYGTSKTTEMIDYLKCL